jgi:hypothetical protein
MYIRRLRVRGRTYYQICRAARDGDAIRQRVVLALGRTSSLTIALREMTAKLDALKLRRSQLPEPRGPKSKTLRAKIETLDARIATLPSKIDMLTEMIKNKSVTPPKRKGK